MFNLMFVMFKLISELYCVPILVWLCICWKHYLYIEWNAISSVYGWNQLLVGKSNEDITTKEKGKIKLKLRKHIITGDCSWYPNTTT